MDLLSALFWAGGIVCASWGVFLVFLFCLPDASILRASSLISSSHARACPLCGMTHAFLSIAHGDFRGAQQLNQGSLFLFSVMSTGLLLFLFGVLSPAWRYRFAGLLVLVQRESYKSDLGISYTFDEFSEASGFFRKDFEERIG
jgi:hypothetical protein